MARTYKRDSNGRFAGVGGGSGGGGKSRPATKQLQRGTNRLTRDNAGRITSVGGSGATAYGGRIRTASGKRRATTVAKGIGKGPKGTVGKTRGMKPLRATTAKPDAAMVNIPMRGSKARGKSQPSAMNQGRIKQFTDMKKVTDTEIRKVRQQIKDARSNATTFGAVPGLRLRLLELQSQSKRHRDTIASAKASTQK